jgi:YfiH family protein
LARVLEAHALEGLPHGFSTREGATAADILPGGALVRVKQVHSPDVKTVTADWRGDPPEADAMVTDLPGLVLGIVTADCAPVLLADREAGVIGAAHAGWRGANRGVIANTVAAMAALGARPDKIVAAIGPCIAQASYEVDAPFREQFELEDAPFFRAGRSGHWQFDLPGYVAARLEQAGVGWIESLNRDTYAEAGLFHSYRRASHRPGNTGATAGETSDGRQISLIALR